MKTKYYNFIYSWIIIASIIAIVILTYGYYNQKDNFTIYKNECKNIKNNNIYIGCFSGCVYSYVYFERFNISFYELIKFDGECFDYCENLSTEQSCSKFEVDEIEYLNCYNVTRYRTREEFCKWASNYEETKNQDDVNRCINSGMYEYDMYHSPESNLITTDTINCNIQTILKKDITKEWLNFHCECYTYCNLNNDCGGEFKVKDESCSKYNCFSYYEVEIQ